MTTTDYLIDSALVLLVLLQIRERELTTRSLTRPLVIVAIAVAEYLHGIPTAGNDLVLAGTFALLGATIGLASGQAVRMRRSATGEVLARGGWLASCLWVLGMGSRFAFIYWITHTGAATLAHFSAQHSISGGEAWNASLLAMAVAEVTGRTAILAARRRQLQIAPVAQLA